MANKRRPKKIKAPYRKYVGGQGFVRTQGFTNGSESDTVGAIEELKESQDIIHTPQGTYYYDLKTESVVLLAAPPPLPSDCTKENSTDAGEMVLPWEIFELILTFCERIEPQFLAVCRHWYHICIPILYRVPKLTSNNFGSFVDAVVNNRKKRMGENVVELDLSLIIQSGKNSYVSKLLRRCSPKLESFVAPQTSFGYAPLISLKSCRQLKYLDLGLVSETVQLGELLSAINEFPALTHLSFPRSSVDCKGFRDFKWPPNLQYLKLSGGISNEFVRETVFPTSIKNLEFAFCPQIDEHSVYTVLAKIGDRLTHLRIYYPMPSLHDTTLDVVFRYCTNLITLQMPVDYCSKWAFSEYMLIPLPDPRPLRVLMLECSGNLGQAFKVHPDDITIALAEGRLPKLRKLRISSKLGWDSKGSDVNDLISCLEDQDADFYLSYF